MRRFLPTLLLLVLVSQNLLRLGVLAWYEYNRDFIAAAFCINRDRPDLHCDGKCYLQKQLQKLDCCAGEAPASAADSPVKKQVKAESPVFLVPGSPFWGFAAAEWPEPVVFTAPAHFSQWRAADIFHPPRG